MKRARLLILLVLVLGASATALWWYVSRARRADRLELAGTIEANTVDVGSLLGGRVAAVNVREGDVVRPGQPIITFETALPDLELAEQQAVVAQAQAELARTKRGPRPEELQQARIAWQSAETDRKRFEVLAKAGIVARRDYDAAEVKASTALEVLRAAERGGRSEDIAASEATVAQQQRRLEFLSRQHQELVVTAPKGGLVEVFNLRPGDLVAADQPVATLLEPEQVWVRVFVPETQLAHVRLGQPAAIRVDSFPHRAFAGRVIEIRTQGEYTPRNVQTIEQRADQVFGLKVAIDPRPELKPGMAATVTLGGAEPSPATAPVRPLK